MPPFKDRTGQQFGRLTALRRVENTWRKTVRFLCLCECGTEVVVEARHLANGITRSCGCWQRENWQAWLTIHGATVQGRKSRTYNRWSGMIQRCTNPREKRYKDYGGRGITVCERWRHSFPAFLTDMGECPPGLMLERINNDAGYSPDNCKWATPKEQANNTRWCVYKTVNGRTQTISQWAEETGIPRGTLRYRFEAHPDWPAEKLFVRFLNFK